MKAIGGKHNLPWILLAVAGAAAFCLALTS
jgi:hypothetical protein